jgi:aspartyl/asparaginyl-tRNA synthetase
MSEEELTEKIVAKGEEIRLLKAAKPATLKEDLAPLVADLLALKIAFKETTGGDYGGVAKEEKKKDVVVPAQVQREGPSKAELNKLKRKEAKAAHKAETKQDETAVAPETTASDAIINVDEGDTTLYGDAPLVCSATMTDRVFKHISDLTPSLAGSTIWLRGRIGNSRAVSKGCFLVVRQNISSIQAIVWQRENIPKAMVKYAQGLSLETVIDIKVTVAVPETPVLSTSIKNLELRVLEIHAVSKAQNLPFIVDDAGRNEKEALEKELPMVKQDTALDYRWIDTRTPANQAIFRIQSGVCQLFREFFIKNRFIEIHTPKLIGGSSEGGSNVFKLSYFDQPACLAQSPQLYKQMAAACGGFDRVFEIGPVFRAENSNTHRHLCEFTGLDFEMSIIEHYYEALDMMANMFVYMFDGIADRYQHELAIISQQYPFEPISYPRVSLRLTFAEGIALLHVSSLSSLSYAYLLAL